MGIWKHHCDNLGLSEDATKTRIRRAWRKKAKMLHPDRNGDSQESREQFQRLSDSYQYLLRNLPVQRAARATPLSRRSAFSARHVQVLFAFFLCTVTWLGNLPSREEPMVDRVPASIAQPVPYPERARDENGQGSVFSSQAIEFRLPDKWECQNEGEQWTCQSTKEEKKRDAMLVVHINVKKTGKAATPNFLEELSKPKKIYGASGEAIVSELRFAKEIRINDYPWVESLYYQSELPDFNTRYLAATSTDINFFLAFSFRADKASEYTPMADDLARSLCPFHCPAGVKQN